jgi:glycosyltransferase involved in cell wall biosynthesis
VQTLDPEIGGVAPAVLALSRGMAKRGHNIDILTLDDAAPDAVQDLPVHAIGHGLTSYRYSRRLDEWLRQNGARYDRVIVNGIWQYLSFATWRRFAGSQTPYYVFPHGMLDPWFKRIFPLKHLKKWLYWPWGEYRVLRDATAVIFTSEEERIQARQSFWLYRCRERVSPLGLEDVQVSPDAKNKFLAAFPSLGGKRILLFLGRLHPKKGCDLLVDALSARADFSLVLAGPDQVGWQKELETMANAKGIADRVVFTGMLQGDIKQGAFAAADAFILPSHQENFGMSVVEALAAGVPVLISNCVNIWREIQQDEAGYVDDDSLEGTRRLIERWQSAQSEKRDAMRRNARQCFLHRFQIDRAVGSLLSTLNESVATR